MIYLAILQNSKFHSIAAQCKVLGISRNSFYNWKHFYHINLEKRAKLLIKILDIYWNSNGIYGAPRITIELEKEGFSFSQKKIANEMKFLGIKSIHTKNFPHRKSPMTLEEKALIKNLIINLNIWRINQVWTTDITYIKTVYDGTLYLISFIDYFSKKVVGWFLSRNQKTVNIEIAFNIAFKKRKPLPGLIIHSDKGAQFRSKSYRKLLSNHHCLYSYTELNHSCDQNAAQESFHATLKKECIYNTTLYHYEDAYKTIFDYIEGFYNPKRIHSSIGGMSPVEFEKSQISSKTPSKCCTKY